MVPRGCLLCQIVRYHAVLTRLLPYIKCFGGGVCVDLECGVGVLMGLQVFRMRSSAEQCERCSCMIA